MKAIPRNTTNVPTMAQSRDTSSPAPRARCMKELSVKGETRWWSTGIDQFDNASTIADIRSRMNVS